MAIGIPASLNNILMSCANIVLNQVLISYGDTPVAAMGVAMKANMLLVLLQIGLCSGIQPLIGYNYGARNRKRLMQVFRFTGICAVVMGTLLTILMVAARETIIRAFMMYKPLQFFTILGSVPFLAGMGVGVRFLVYLYRGQEGGHVQSLILASTLLMIGFMTYMIGLQADIIAANRKILEDVQYQVRKTRYVEIQEINRDRQKGEKEI